MPCWPGSGPGPCDAVLEQLAVVPHRSAGWWTYLCQARARGLWRRWRQPKNGVCSVSTRKIAFRHELTRRAIVGSAARLLANQRVLDALIEHDGSDVSRIVHHAAQAGDRDAHSAGYGPAAGRDAAAGAHREAVAHFGLVLEHQGRFARSDAPTTGTVRDRVLHDRCHRPGGRSRTACGWTLNRSRGDLRELGACLRWLSRIWWMAGDRTAANRPAGGDQRAGAATTGCSRWP